MPQPLRSIIGTGLVLVALLTLSSCDRHSPEPYHAELYVFGTLVEITILGVDPERASRAVSAVNTDFRRMHRDWHAWKPGALTRINDLIARGEPAPVIPSLVPIIEQSKALYRKSGGLFNPAIGRLLRLWGFQQDTPPDGPPPPRDEIAALVAQGPGMDDVHLRDGTLVSDNRFVQLDFGAFAKGYAIDLAIERIREMGIDNAIVNAGGDLRAIGTHGDRPWRVGVRHPQGEGVLASLDVSGDESVFTSGNYERYREHEGVHYAHILDPRTGMPVQGITSVTVLHENGAVADAAATALVVAGVDSWYEVASSMGIHAVMLVEENGVVHMTPAMEKRIHFVEQPEHVEISKPL